MSTQTPAAQFDSRAARVRAALRTLAYAAPWVVFGPITGVMSGVAIRCFRAGQPVRGVLWLLANLGVLLSIPALTVAVLRLR
jgi:hypothetical protein